MIQFPSSDVFKWAKKTKRDNSVSMINGGMETTDDDAESKIRSPRSAHSITRCTSYLRVQTVAVGTREAGGGSQAASIRGAGAHFSQLTVNKYSFS